MKKFFLTVLAAGFLSMFCVQPVTADNGWELVEDKDGIRLYEKQVDCSRYRAFKAVAEIDAVMAVIGEVIRDVAAYPEWMETIKEARILKQYDANNMDVYLVMSIPFPFYDRDAVVKAQTTIDSETGDLTVHSQVIEDPPVPEQDGLVRLPYMDQTFDLAYKTYEKTEVTFTLHIETGGVLPVKAVNMVTQSVPYKSMQNLRQIVHKDKYQVASPFTPENIGITQTITSSILRKYITDKDIIGMVVSDRNLLETAIRNGYAEEGVRATARAIVREYVTTPMYSAKIQDSPDKQLLSQLITDRSLLDELITHRDLAELVLNTGGMTEQVMTALASQIRKAHAY